MSNQRVLSHQVSRKVAIEDLEQISAAGTSVATAHATYSAAGGKDFDGDLNIDL